MLWLFCRRCAGMFRKPVIVALCPYCQSKRTYSLPPQPGYTALADAARSSTQGGHSVVVISRQHHLNTERIERASDFQDHIPIECVLRIAIIRGCTAGLAFFGAAEWLGPVPQGAANAVRNPADGRSLGLLLSGDALRNMWLRLYT
jgi:hypothetical protein